MTILNAPHQAHSSSTGHIEYQLINQINSKGHREGLYRYWQMKPDLWDKESQSYTRINDRYLERELTYKQDQVHGLCRRWYENGQLEEECTYHQGQLHGLYRSWHSNGQLGRYRTYRFGRLIGWYYQWHPNGQLHGHCYRHKGKNTFIRVYSDQGELCVIFNNK